MANPKIYNWPAANTTLVAPLQTLAGAGNLALNFNGLTPNAFDFQGLNRAVSLTSTNNLGGVHFVVTGTLNGLPVSENRVGPNNNTVATTQLFSTVTSIRALAAAAAVSAGSGFLGNTGLFFFDPHCNVCDLSCAVVVTNGTGGITYSFAVTLDDPTLVTPTYFTPITAMTGATTTLLGNLTQPVKYCTIQVTVATGTASLVATILQQGLKS